jgi:hypothetical protein
MASERKFHTSLQPSDLALQAEDGGGIKFDKNGKFLFGAKQQSTIDELDKTNYEGNLEVDPNNQSFIAIMNENSHALDVEVGNKNDYSLNPPNEDVIGASSSDNQDCGGEDKSNKEFEEISKTLLEHENNYTDLGWDAYGANGSGIQSGELTKAQEFYYDNYWIANAKNNLGNITLDINFVNTNNGSMKSRSMFDIQTFPSGLRSLLIRSCYNSGKTWINRLLVTARNLDPNKQLGITEEESTEGGKNPIPDLDATGKPYHKKVGSLSFEDKVKKMNEQYKQILDLYNKDKSAFLDKLKKEFDRFYNLFVEQKSTEGSTNYEERFKKSKDRFITFYSEYNSKALEVAKKYMDCPNEYEIKSIPQQPVPTTNQSQTPAPSPTPSPSPKKAYIENNEEIYDINFLPSREYNAVDTNIPYIETFENSGVDEGGGINDAKVVTSLENGSVTAADSIGTGGGEGDGNAPNENRGKQTIKSSGKLYEVEFSPAADPDVSKALTSAHNGAKNAIEAAYRMNPTNAKDIANLSVSKWKFDAKNNPFLRYINIKLGCPVQFFLRRGDRMFLYNF